MYSTFGYVTGVALPVGVPLEELVFFVVIPLCALLSFESVRNLLDGEVRWFEALRTRLVSADPDRNGA